MSELRNIRNEKLKKNSAFAVLIFLFLGIFAAAFMSIGLLSLSLLIVVIPFVVIPLFFSFQRAVIIMRDKNTTLSFKMIWEGFVLYFNERFFSTYNVIKVLLWGILVYVCISIVTSLTINLSFYFTNYLGYGDFLNGLIPVIKQMDAKALEDYINSYSYVLNMVDLYSVLPTLFLIMIYNIYFLSRNGVSMFLRFSAIKYPGKYLTLLHLRMIKENRKSFFKDYWRLNWPLYVIFSGGMVLGGYLGYLYKFNASVMFTFAIMVATFLTCLSYGFVFIANKEALYIKYIDAYKKADETIKEQFNQMMNARLEALQREQQHIIDMKQDSELDHQEEPKQEEEK